MVDISLYFKIMLVNLVNLIVADTSHQPTTRLLHRILIELNSSNKVLIFTPPIKTKVYLRLYLSLALKYWYSYCANTELGTHHAFSNLHTLPDYIY